MPGGYDIFVDYLGSSTCSTWKDEPKLNLKSPGDSDVEQFFLCFPWKSMIEIYDILRCSSSHIWIECNQVDNFDMRLWEAVIQVLGGSKWSKLIALVRLFCFEGQFSFKMELKKGCLAIYNWVGMLLHRSYNWVVLSDEQINKRWPFSLKGVKHLPDNISLILKFHVELL